MRYLAVLSILVVAGGTAAAATAPDKNLKPAASRHVPHRARSQTTGHPLASSLSDSNAGIGEQGTPNTAVINGGELAH